MKLIFLDFDGVVNSVRGIWAEQGGGIWDLDSQLVTAVVRMANDTDAKLVISSTWRKGRSVKELTELLEGKLLDTKLKVDIHGKTPDLWTERGKEIEYYLTDLASKGVDVTEYVIIDDDSDMLEHQKANFVHTDGVEGITLRDIHKCYEILDPENKASEHPSLNMIFKREKKVEQDQSEKEGAAVLGGLGTGWSG